MNARALILLSAAAIACTGMSPVVQPEADSRSLARVLTQTTELLPGVARPWREVVQAAPFDGTLMSVSVREGDRVAKGQIVATIDNRTALAAVAAAEAAAQRTGELEHARAGLALAEKSLERLQASRDQGAASQAAIDEALAARDQAAATLVSATEQLTQAKRNLELERVRLELHNVRAPFSGTVVRVHKDPGSAMTTAEPIVHLLAIDRLRVDLHLPLRLYDTLTIGASYVLSASAPADGPVIATLQSIEPVIDPATRTFRCAFLIDNSERAMPAGVTIYPELTGDGMTQIDATSETAMEEPRDPAPTR